MRLTAYLILLLLSNVTDIFSPKIQGKWSSIQARPTGQLDLLIGANVLGLHPVDLELRDNLRVKKSRFGGHILTGSHPAVTTQKIVWNDDVNHIGKCSPAANEISVNQLPLNSCMNTLS